MFQKMLNRWSGFRTLSRQVEGGTTRLGVNLAPGQDIGTVNNFFIEFKNGRGERVIDNLDTPLWQRILFPRVTAEIEKNVNSLLEKEGYLARW